MIIFIIILFVWTSSSVDATSTPNVGTVLFSKNDAHNMTWPKSKLALLKARLYAQHLIPPLNLPETPDFIDALLTYFHDCYTSIRQESQDLETEQILATAFTDVVGGYLKMFALPLTKYGYYSGTLPKRDAIKLFLFYEDVKNFLGKDDQAWTGPSLPILKSVTINVAMPPFSYSRRDLIADPCQHLSYVQRTSRGLLIPTPIIDWNTHTMFVPLANQSLVNLYSPNNSNALHKYYDVASSCVRSERPNDLDNFNERFQTFLRGDVLPHLRDDRLYNALEGVLSLVNSTNDHTAYAIYKDVESPDFNIKFDHSHLKPHMFSTKIIIVLVIVAIELIWCLPTVIYMLFRRKKDRKGGGSSCLKKRADKSSDSVFDSVEQDSSNMRKTRRDGFKFQQRRNDAMEVREVYSGRMVCTTGTDTPRRLLEQRSDAATMADEVPKGISTTQTKRSKRSVRRISTSTQNESAKQLSSDEKSKTAMILVQSPSKATTLMLFRPSTVAQSADANTESCPRDPRLHSCLSCFSKQNSNSLGKELAAVVTSASAELSSREEWMCRAPVERVRASEEVVIQAQNEIECATSARPVKRTRRSRKSLKAITDDKSLMAEVEKEPLLQISIDRPQQEVSVDVSRHGEITKVKRPKKSKIPKKAKGMSPQMMMGTRTTVVGAAMMSTRLVATHRSLIPRLKRATDDIALLQNVGTKTPKLNVTL